jgi:hypothetical protein
MKKLSVEIVFSIAFVLIAGMVAFLFAWGL